MKLRTTTTLMFLFFAVAISGCATTDKMEKSAGAADTKMAMEEEKAALAAQKAQLDQQAADLAAQRAELEKMKTAGGEMPQQAATNGDLNPFPPNAKAGECYARAVIPAQYENVTEKVVKREAAERIDVIPAKFGPGTEKVLVKEATTRLEVIPPVYETVTERLLVRPASKKVVEVPAKYKTVTEKILDKPAHTVWKRSSTIGAGYGAGSGAAVANISDFVNRTGSTNVVATRVDNEGDIMCLVEVPASYKTVSKKVLVSPATTSEVEIPAKYATVKKRVVKKPGTTRAVTIPAVYKTVKITKLLQPPQEKRTPIPAVYETVSTKKLVSPPSARWMPVLCQANMTRANVSALQSSLKREGCYKCKVDGAMGKCTYAGARCYAKRKGLPYGSNFVTTQVIKSLALRLN